jgi:hypothetical protein
MSKALLEANTARKDSPQHDQRGAIDPERVASLTAEVEGITSTKIAESQKITGRTNILALNALIEAARGRGRPRILSRRE